MKTRLLSVLLAGTLLFSGVGELAVSAQAVEAQSPAPSVQVAENQPAVQEQTATDAQSISIYPNQLWMRAGEQTQLTASILPDDCEETVSWSGNDSSVCSVSEDGTVTALNNGTAEITAQAGSVSATCTVQVGLTAPTLSSIVIDDEQHASLSWDPVPDCDGYRVSRRASESDEWQDMETLTGTNWTDMTMTAVTGWQYGVRAYKLRNSQTDDEETLWSDYVCAEVPVVEQQPELDIPARPAAPVLVGAEALSSGGIRISWNAVSGASGYRVYRKNGSKWDLLRVIKSPSATSYIDASAEPATTYTYTVRAFSRGGKKILLSDYDAVGVSTTAVTISVPHLEDISSSAYDRLTVTWTEVRKAEGYVLYRRTSPTDSWTKLTTITSGTTDSYTDTTVTCGQTYYYTLSAYCTVGDKKIYSSYDEAGISGKALPAAPALKSAVSASATSITLTWGTVSGASGYRMYRRTSTSEAWTCIGDLTGSTRDNYTNTGLKTGQRYYYTVAAFCKLSDGTIVKGPYNTTGISAVPTAKPYGNVYATYSTQYKSSQVNRTTNLNIACKTINGTILKPGETFSFNGTLGVRTPEKGYKPATIFTGSSGTAQEVGGGICQVASTMFNTALLANSTIVERYPHSQKVNYCPVGRDAGIYYGSKNFQFKNNTNYNIKIKSWISDGTLTVQLLTTEQVKPPSVSLSVSKSGNTYTLKRTVNGKVNYTTKSTY
ncbi:MAG: VanW family protein [Butyricicoccus porcorum]